MAGKKTCHVTRAHLVPDRFLRASVFPSPSSPAPKKTRRRRRRKEYGEGTRPLSFLFRSFLAHHRLSELGSIIDRNSSEIRHTNDRGCLSKGRIPKHTPREYIRRRKVVVVRKKEDEEKKQHALKTTLTHRLETSLFGAVTRTDWAAAVWVKENMIVLGSRVLCKCVLK